jgi:hypothetical protein
VNQHLVSSSRFGPDPHENLSAGREFDGIADEVDEHLPQTRRVAEDAVGNAGVDIGNELELLAVGLHCQRLESAAKAVAEAELDLFQIELAGLDLREIEDVVDQRQQRFGRLLNDLEVLALHRRKFGPQDEVGHADDGVHRRADFVAHAGQKRALGAVGSFGLVPGAGQLGISVGEGPGGAAAFNRVANRPFEHRRSHVPLHQVVLGPFLHRRERGGFVLESAEDDHRDRRRGFLHGAKRVEAAAVGELQIKQNGLDFSARQALEGLREPLDMFDVEIGLAGVSQQLTNEQGVVRAVFDEQQMNCLAFHRWPSRSPRSLHTRRVDCRQTRRQRQTESRRGGTRQSSD